MSRALMLSLWVALVGCRSPRDSEHGGPRAPLVQRAHASVNGIRLYYEIHGPRSGTPLVLLPGGGSSIEVTYGRILPFLSQHRQVIAIDEQNHGRSEHRSIPERFTDSADDVASLLRQLGIQQADVMGFSNGASVAMQVALRHRELVRKLVFTGSMTKKSGAPAQFWQSFESMTFDDMPQSLKESFLAINPDVAQLRDMYEKDSERMRSFVETSDDDVRSLQLPTLIILGDRDVPTPEHAAELLRLLPNGQLLMLGRSHGEFLGEPSEAGPESDYAEVSAKLVARFLDH